MYAIILGLHNILRWVVVVVAAIALIRAYLGWLGGRGWTGADRTIAVVFSSAMDTQLLVGFLLYIFFSPLTRAVFQNFSEAMSNPDLRFFGLEHLVYMVVAVALVHIGSSRAKKADGDENKHRQSAIWFSIAVVIILVGIPWSRPLFPGLG
jgi:hypothetical protein